MRTCISIFAFATVLAMAQDQPDFVRERIEITEPPRDADGFSTERAKICATLASGNKQCYTAPAGFYNQGKVTFVGLPESKNGLVFFINSHNAFGGFQTSLALLVPGPKESLRNLLARNTAYSERGEFEFWQDKSISPWPVLSIADYVWGRDESRNDQHYYEIRTLLLDARSGQYTLRDHFQTRAKYATPSLDDRDRVLDSEKTNLIAHLERTIRQASGK